MTRAPTRSEPIPPDHATQASPEWHRLLARAVEEVARLLDADGAMAYLVDAETRRLRFSVDAGIGDPEVRRLIQDLSLPVGVGLFGHAVETGEVVVSGDYRNDPTFQHSEIADRIVDLANMRSMAAAPLVADGRPLGAIGVYSSRPQDFDEAEVTLLRALADHAAAAMANQQLVDRLSSSEARFRHLVTSSPDLVWEVGGDGRFTFLSPRLTELTGWEPAEMLSKPWSVIVEPSSIDEVQRTWEALRTKPSVVFRNRFLLRRRDGDPIPAEMYAVGSERDGHFAGAHGTIRDLSEAELLAARLQRQTTELERRVEAQRTLAEMAAQLTSLRDPSVALEQTLREAVRLLDGDGGQIGMVLSSDGVLRWGHGHSFADGRLVPFTKEERSSVDNGVSGRAVRERRATWTDDYLADDSFQHDRTSDEIARRLGIRAVIAAPLLSEDAPIGAIGVFSHEPRVFDRDAAELLGLLADQAAIVLTNARLYEQAAVAAERLAHRVEAQRTLGEIAAAITSLRDPSAVLRRTVAEVKRLLAAEHVVVHQVRAGTQELADYQEVFGAATDTAPVGELTITIGQGVAGRAVAERTVAWTGNYLDDDSFPHTDRADEWIRRFGYHSQMSAPMIGESGPLGAITAYSTRRDAFGEDDAQLLGALAAQAAIVLGNARLYEELHRRVEAQRALGEIAARITAIRDAGDVLQRTLDEAVRLLDADGGRIELVSEDGGLHWAFGHSAIDLPIERDDEPTAVEGVSGRAVLERRVIRTGDYLSDPSFEHVEPADRYIRQHGIRSVMSAPLTGEEGAIGSLTVHSQSRDAFDEANAELLEVLASQAAIAVANARLYEQLRERIEAQRALASISAEIAALHDPAAVLQRTAEEALRLLRADSAVINPLENDDRLLGWPLASAPLGGAMDEIPVRAGEGVTGKAMAEHRVVWTGDYLADRSFEHSDERDALMARRGMRSVMAAPLVSSAGDLGALTVHASRADAFSENDAELLRLLADQAAIAITNARLYDELGEESAALARQIDSQRKLLQINQSLLSTLDPASVLQHIADGLKSVVWYDNFALFRVEDDGEVLRAVLARDRNAEAVLDFRIPRGQGITWWSIEHREPVRLDDALSDPRVVHIPNTPSEEEAIIIVPLISGDQVIGAMNIARSGGAYVAFTDMDFELAQLFAGQATIAVTNARLVEELRERADAQRSLAEIASQIAALHDPLTVIQRAVADAARLLSADRAQINLAVDGGTHLDRPISAAPTPPSPDDVMVPIGSGIAGMAAAERRVRWTGDYLADQAFPHDEGDVRIAAQDIHSMMSAPLIGPDRLLGTITVQSTARNAFDAEDAELLKLLADQAAIALTNASLYAELRESERRYRHLVDNSPDIVWSLDADGRITFLSDALESRTGYRPEQLLGRPFTALATPETLPAAEQAWANLKADPNREQRIRLDLPLPDGHISQAEVALTGTVVDGRFAGAHGALRDISERERLEGDLRSQAAELAASQERAHLARELHDSVTQALFSMGLTLRTLELLLEADPPAARAKLAELRELQKDALAEMRTLIFELRPSSLEADGLVQALRTHATAVQRRTGLTIIVDAEPIDRMPLAMEEALYRIAQEALHNVVKHANASNATVRIAREGEGVRVVVSDDGIGFDPDAVPRGQHLGLLGMRQRLDLVGGELEIESRPGAGTTISATAPAAGAGSVE